MTNLGNNGPVRKNLFVRLGKYCDLLYPPLSPSAMTTRTGILPFATVIAVTLMASGCGGGSAVDPVASIAGSYVLQSANGQLPLRFFRTDVTGQTTIDIMSGTLAVGSDRTFVEVLQYHVTPPTAPAYDAPILTNGTFTLSGSTITFTYHPAGGQPYVWGGTVSASTITYTDAAFADITGGLTAVYTK
jgi:hypothetical protein